MPFSDAGVSTSGVSIGHGTSSLGVYGRLTRPSLEDSPSVRRTKMDDEGVSSPSLGETSEERDPEPNRDGGD